jgi:CheY-like chemotaxis protein
MMPVMDGWAFREAMRRLPDGLGEVPVIVLTGAREVHAHAESLGAAAALPKPFDLDEVLEAVDRVLRR